MPERSNGVVAVVIDDARFLLIRRGPSVRDAGYWGPVTGTVEPGETQNDAVIREVREEVGLEVRPVRKVWECVSWNGTHDLHWWLAVRVGGHLVPEPREVSEARWCDAGEYAGITKTFPTDRVFFTSIFPSLGVGGSDAD